MIIHKNKQTDPVARAKARLLFAGFCFFIAFLAIGFRLADLTLMSDKQTAKRALLNSDMNEKNIGKRLNIRDRNGELLAISVASRSLYADAKQIKNPEAVAAQLIDVFPDMNKEALVKKLSSNNRFIWIKRHLSPDQAYAVNKLGIPGLDFQDEHQRLYPHAHDFAHVLGYTNVDNKGLAGLESGLEDRLSDINAARDHVALTVDTRIQHIVKDELRQAIERFDAKAGSAVVMNAKTGEILALTSLPDFDPHHPGQSSADARFNRTTLGVYEMGSTFKLFSAAAALEEGGIVLKDRFDCTKPLKYGRFTINDYHAKKRVMNVPEIFLHSSNIGHALMAEKVGNEKSSDFYRRLGFYDRLNLEITERGSPLTPNPWRNIHTVTTSYGHGIAVTPLHLVSAAATLLNGGFRVTPTLVKQDTPPIPTERVVSARTSEMVREMMRATVILGTGQKGDAEGYLVGGKTGTSEKAKSGRYDTKSLMSSFIAAFPMNNPEFIVYVMVDEPIGNQTSYGYATGGWVAAPAAKNIIQRMSSVLGIRPVSQEETDQFDKSMAVIAVLPDELVQGRKRLAAQ